MHQTLLLPSPKKKKKKTVRAFLIETRLEKKHTKHTQKEIIQVKNQCKKRITNHFEEARERLQQQNSEVKEKLTKCNIHKQVLKKGGRFKKATKRLRNRLHKQNKSHSRAQMCSTYLVIFWSQRLMMSMYRSLMSRYEPKLIEKSSYGCTDEWT